MPEIYFVLLITLFLPMVVLTSFIPYFTRQTESFGITVSEEVFHSADLKRMRKRYAASNFIIQAILAVIALAMSVRNSDSANVSAMWIMIYVLLSIVTQFLTMIYFHKTMKKYKAERLTDMIMPQVKLTIDMNFRKQKLVISKKWYLIHAVLIIATFIFTLMNYDLFPDKIVTQYDFQGNPTTIKDKSIGTVFMPVVMQIMMTLLFMFINTVIYRSKQQVDTEHPEASLEKNRIFRLRNSVFNLFASLMIILLFSFMQLQMLYPVDPVILAAVCISVVVLILVGTGILYVTTGQGGSRVKSPVAPSTKPPRDDDQNWKLGMFYFNPQDPSLFVEKRMGYGWTINHARPLAWIILVGIIGSVVLVSVLL
ncbi:DUF5808 domain-containing protein [Paenibacillus polygoni]|uniref:DUF5808 domain-containing protein n=1 Tax=Paenibacillus polygoni TaxID=3050112 RepID=A0ABY8WYB2_9BACL|nr:DUF5808 domain-containing protein [Paenibacillus polygoni]WIV17683.1 DUF5808 domain-containing protein [Paenibacillus polygoni]